MSYNLPVAQLHSETPRGELLFAPSNRRNIIILQYSENQNKNVQVLIAVTNET